VRVSMGASGMLWKRRLTMTETPGVNVKALFKPGLQVRRRHFLALAPCLAAVAACGPVASLRGAPSSGGYPIRLLTGDDAAGAAAFAAYDPRVAPVITSQIGLYLTPAGWETAEAPPWAITQAAPHAPPVTFTPLDADLRAINYDPANLVRGAAEAFTRGGIAYGLPIHVAPVAVRYRPDALAAAGVLPPSDTWTLDALDQICSELQRARSAGRLPGYAGVLPPIPTLAPDVTQPPPVRAGAMFSALVWGGFIRAESGSLGGDGSFALGNSVVRAAIDRFVALARAFAAPQSAGPFAKTPLDFFAYFSDAAIPSGNQWHLAPFPRGAGSAPVPVVFQGVGLAWEDSTGIVNPDKAIAAPAPAVDAVVHYGLWKLDLARRGQTSGPPVVADPAVQSAYWSAAAQHLPGADRAAQWTRYADVQAGWPPTLGVRPETVIYNALVAAATGESGLSAALTVAQDRLDSGTAAYVQAAAADPVQ